MITSSYNANTDFADSWRWQLRAHLVIPSEQSAFQGPTCCPLISFSFKESRQAPALCFWLRIRYDQKKKEIDENAFNHWIIYLFVKIPVFEPRGWILGVLPSLHLLSVMCVQSVEKCHCFKTVAVLSVARIRHDKVTVVCSISFIWQTWATRQAWASVWRAWESDCAIPRLGFWSRLIKSHFWLTHTGHMGIKQKISTTVWPRTKAKQRNGDSVTQQHNFRN